MWCRFIISIKSSFVIIVIKQVIIKIVYTPFIIIFLRKRIFNDVLWYSCTATEKLTCFSPYPT